MRTSGLLLKTCLTTAAVALCFSLNAQTFSPPDTAAFNIVLATQTTNLNIQDYCLDLVDLDGDGDLDLLVSTGANGTIEYFENIGTPTNPDYSASQAAPFNLPSLVIPYDDRFHISTVDIDNDGDYDLFYTTGGGAISFCENIGDPQNPDFSSAIANPFGMQGSPIYYYATGYTPAFVDIDDDGDMDIFSGASYVSGIHFYENTGTPENPQFGVPVIDPLGLSTLNSNVTMPAFGDFDQDGDFDMIMGAFHFSNGVDTLYYFENIGTKCNPYFEYQPGVNFDIQLYDPDCYIVSPTLADMDADNDLDLFIGYTGYGDLYYYEQDDSGVIPTTIGKDHSFIHSACDSWFFGDSIYTTSGIYEYTTTSSLGCDSTTTVDLNINSIVLSTTVSNDTIYADENTAAYQWINCDTGFDIPGETDPYFAPVESGNYAVEITDSACVDTSACENIIIAQIDNQNLSSQGIKIWPNPTDRQIFIDLMSVSKEDLPLVIRNSIGQVVVSESLPSGTQHYKLDLDQPKGIYFLSILGNTYKVIIK